MKTPASIARPTATLANAMANSRSGAVLGERIGVSGLETALSPNTSAGGDGVGVVVRDIVGVSVFPVGVGLLVGVDVLVGATVEVGVAVAVAAG